MADTAPELSHPVRVTDVVTYEQPLNERMRTFLRLIFLFRQASFHAANTSSWASRASIGALLDILAILGRGDVRGEVLKELERHAAMFTEYQFRQEVDPGRLASLLDTIKTLRGELQAAPNLTQHLRDNEFLSAVKHRSAIPGGTCDFDLPEYNYWLSRAYELRANDLNRWLSQLRPLRDSVNELIWLTRESSSPSEEVAHNGIFQRTLERGIPCQLIRVSMHSGTTLFPEISGSPHRFTIRFQSWAEPGQRPQHTRGDVPFSLTCC